MPDHPFAEAVAVRDVLRTLLENRELLKIGGPQAAVMANALRNLDAVVARGAITPGERAGMIGVARLILLSVL